MGRIRQVVDRNGRTRKYDYNAADQRIEEIDHTDGVTTHTYNARGGLASTTAPGLGVTIYRYDGADRLVETGYANLARTTRGYDAAGQLETLKHLRAGGTLHAETYVHDDNGNRTSLTVEDGSTPQVTTYTYDVADRLVSEVSSTRRVLDTLDAAGNRVERLIQDGAGVLQQKLVYTVNARDQVTGIETRNSANAVTGTEVLVYDANGNRIGRSVGGVTQTHRYDRRNRELARGGVRYEHNDADVRTAQVDGGLRTEWVMDGLSLQAEVRGGTTVAQYRYGRELIGEVRGAVGRTILSDGHRSPVVVLESTGNVTDRVRYSAAGEVQARTGSSPLAFGYGGYLTQAGTEELYAFARTYRPGLARFNEVDPLRSFDAQLGMGSHRYVLGYGNPIRYVDPDGWQSISINVQSCNENGSCRTTPMAGSALRYLSPSQMATPQQGAALIESQARMTLFGGGRTDSPMVVGPMLASGAGRFEQPYIEHGSLRHLSMMQSSADLDRSLGMDPNYVGYGRATEVAGEAAVYSLPPVAVASGVQTMANAETGLEFAAGAVEATLGVLPMGMAARAEYSALRAEFAAARAATRAPIASRGGRVYDLDAEAGVGQINHPVKSVVVEQPSGDVATKVERRAALQRMSEALRYRALGWNHEQGKFSVIETMAISRAESAYGKRFLPSNTEGVDVIDPSGWGNVSLKGPFLNKNLKPLTVEQQMKAVGSVQKHVRQNTAVDTHIIDTLGLTDDALEEMQKSLVDESVRIIYVGGD